MAAHTSVKESLSKSFSISVLWTELNMHKCKTYVLPLLSWLAPCQQQYMAPIFAGAPDSFLIAPCLHIFEPKGASGIANMQCGAQGLTPFMWLRWSAHWWVQRILKGTLQTLHCACLYTPLNLIGLPEILQCPETWLHITTTLKDTVLKWRSVAQAMCGLKHTFC